jgi:small subunit ribosomal protein S5
MSDIKKIDLSDEDIAESAEIAVEFDDSADLSAVPEKFLKSKFVGRTREPRGGDEQEDLFEKVVFINRCAKVVKGGRRFSFSALVVLGDRKGKVGFGFGKAQEVSECIKKAGESAKKNLLPVKFGANTIPHPVMGSHGGGRVLLLPASPGTGLIAGAGVRAVVEAAGIKDVMAKSMGSKNHANVVKATLDALYQLRNKDEIYESRGKRVESKRAL